MKEYVDLTEEEQKEMLNKAFTFLHDHSDHVCKLLISADTSVAPSGSDMFRPELWKGIHWLWFESNYAIGRNYE